MLLPFIDPCDASTTAVYQGLVRFYSFMTIFKFGEEQEDDEENWKNKSGTEQDDEEVFLSSKIIHSTTNTSVVANQHMEPLDEHEEKHNFTAFSVETRHLSLEDDENPIKIKKSPVNQTFSEIPKSTAASTRLSRSNSNRSGTTPRSWIRNVSHSSKRFLTKIDSSLMGKEKDEKGNIFAFAQDNEMEQSVTGLDNEKSLEKAKRIKKERKMMVLSIMIVTVMTFVIWYVSITGMFFRDEFIKVKISNQENLFGIKNVVSCDKRFLITDKSRFVPVKVFGKTEFLKFDDFEGGQLEPGKECFIKIRS